jgi:hypothetical protein
MIFTKALSSVGEIKVSTSNTTALTPTQQSLVNELSTFCQDDVIYDSECSTWEYRAKLHSLNFKYRIVGDENYSVMHFMVMN